MRLREKFEKIFPILAEKFPDPKSELNFTNNFQLLVAVMLSAQATDQSVNRATAALFKTVSTPEELLALGESELYDSIKSIGLAKTKARNIISTSQLLVEKYNSLVPDNFNDLISLPGVGSKTARVVLNVGFQQPTIAVDTHIFRVSQRLKLSKGKTPDQISEDLIKLVPPQYMMKAHHYLLLHGRYTCRAQNPQCGICELAEFCSFHKKGIHEKKTGKRHKKNETLPDSIKTPKE